ncbi:MAG: HD domain-containing protein [Lachnospiraceae bacterium]|nr:HD domain-containing protein [Lachnospiraceae bacterium]
MKLCKVSDIVGGEKLARPIMTSNYQELLAAGTVLKTEYIPKIIQLGITEVFIEDSRLSPEQVVILREDMEDFFTEKVRSVLERHIYSDNSDLEELSKTADCIITSILSRDEVVELIYDIRERSADIYEHCISVCSVAVLVAIKKKMDQNLIHDLGVACLFHDIGLRYLDFDYTNIDIESLDEKSAAEYRKHPVYGYSSLEKEPWISETAKKMILRHHERMDGSGYPLHSKDTDELTQILQVSDAFDEMICGIGCLRSRVYEAVEYLKITKGILFNEDIVNTLLDFTAVYPSGTVVILSTGEMGIIIRQNQQFPERPVVRIIKDIKGNTIEDERICDLLKVHNVYIEKVLL